MKTISQPVAILVHANPAGGGGGNLGNLGANSVLDLGPYQCTDAGEYPGSCAYITDYSGMNYDKTRRRMVIFGGGHGSTSYDAVNTFSMLQLKWIEDYAPGNCSTHTTANFDSVHGTWVFGPTGPYPRPLARHTVDQSVIVGDELFLLSSVEGNGNVCISNLIPNYTGYEFRCNAKISRYNMVTKTWSFSPLDPNVGQWPAAEYDPVSGKILSLGASGFDVYDPVAETKVLAIDVTTYAGLAHLVDDHGNPQQNTLTYNNNLVYFPANQKMYYFERSLGDVWELELDRSNFGNTIITKLTTTGPRPPLQQEVGYACDSKNGVICGAVSNNVIYCFNPLTKTWIANAVQNGTPGTMAFHAIAYSDDDNAFVFITDVTSGRHTWAYRYA